MEKRKIYGSIIGVIAFLILIIGATYAFFGWRSTDNVNVNLTINGKDIEDVINYNQGTSILDTTGEALVPVGSYNEGVSTTIEFWKDSSYTKPIYGEISLEVLNLLSKTDTTDTNIAKTDTIKWAITTYNINDSTEVLLRKGSFNGKKIGDKWAIYSDFELNGYQTFYKIYLWIDIMAIDKSLSIEGELLSTEVSASASDNVSVYNIPANVPALTDNLIPVYFDEEVGIWKTASYTNENNNWYNYENKKWANAVLLTETKRNSLTKDADGNYVKDQVIGDTEASGTLAFYVWIPRYKYKVWNKDKIIGTDSYAYDAYNEGIDILFEAGTNTTGTIECNYDFSKIAAETVRNEECTGLNGEYYTHPAFTFGEDELTGFWMGKFQVSSVGATVQNLGGGLDISAGVYASTISPLILPNAISWRLSTIYTFWKNINDLNLISNNIYGLNTDKTVIDSHMITNLEWGAVSYLSHSKYGYCANGTCNEIGINNSGAKTNNNYKVGSISVTGQVSYTGRSANGPWGTQPYSINGTYTYDGRTISSDGIYADYNKNNLAYGGKASTTGNIYGVYDMAGAADTAVMANMSGEYSKYVFGLNQGSEDNYFPYEGNEKYITTYAYGTTRNDQISNNRTRLGDGMGESKIGIKMWYDQGSAMMYFNETNDNLYSFQLRGGTYDGASYDYGMFGATNATGVKTGYNSTRAVLAVY